MQRVKKGALRAVLVSATFLWSLHSYGQVLTGTEAGALDGDTIELNGEPIRLFGIDAPELGQTCLNGKKRWRCGLEAAFTLHRQLVDEPIECTIQGNRNEVREASCTNARGDVAEVMITKGFAQTLDSSFPSYSAAERAARSARLGIWRGEFVPPRDWRAGKRLPHLDDAPVQVCDIKGSIAAGGRRIYVVPTDKHYDTVEIDTDKGERMFCSDDEARLAGWQRDGRTSKRQ